MHTVEVSTPKAEEVAGVVGSSLGGFGMYSSRSPPVELGWGELS